MHVRKFFAETLEEALKQVKKELGPDAIILKTNTQKGAFPPFNKKKVEITAAISEKSLGKKMKVDVILDESQKETLYKNSSKTISNIINDYGETAPGNKGSSYEKLALNKQVSKNNPKRSLDEFINEGIPAKQENYGESIVSIEKLAEIEDKLRSLSERIENKSPLSVIKFRDYLRGLEIEESYVQELVKKAIRDISPEEIKDFEVLNEFAVQEMLKEIKTELAAFSRTNNEGVTTLLISEVASGQSLMIEKLASLKNDSMVIKNSKNKEGKTLASEFFDFTVENVEGISNLLTQCRKGLGENKSVFIDYKVNPEELNDTKKVVEALRRIFPNLEVLINLSSIHSESYNKKVLQKYQRFANGMTIAHLDLCINYGAIFNLTLNFPNLPIKFFGTGEVIPEDIEAASPERLLAGIFRIE
jgi:flagellar biosynthesis protein FlhF